MLVIQQVLNRQAEVQVSVKRESVAGVQVQDRICRDGLWQDARRDLKPTHIA